MLDTTTNRADSGSAASAMSASDRVIARMSTTPSG
jgi:hypothetical protein